MLRRGWDIAWEKTRDKIVRRACNMVGAIERSSHRYRLNVTFECDEPRLDDVDSIHTLVSKVQIDDSLSPKIHAVARCLIASLFFFELDNLPRFSRAATHAFSGRILCVIRKNDPAFPSLLERLAYSGKEACHNAGPTCAIWQAKSSKAKTRTWSF
jgi:hypothetical protein